ncbi:MAG TPA: lipopolysaccharide kinase InaA family protein [Phycisphaerae bacterium]|nr:lipopolysaccharide kinase InaA family protein [Phycisphaerae bacterium]
MGNCELHIREDWRERLAAGGLDSFETLMRTTAGELASKHRRGEVWRLALGGDVLYLKRDSFTMLKEVLADLLAGRRPEPFTVKERLGIERAAAAGMRVAELVAWGQRRRFRLPRQGVLLMRELAGEPLDAWLASHKETPVRFDVLRNVGSQVARLYNAGLFWPDLAPKHVFIDERGSIGLLDLERIRPAGTSTRQMRRQLSRFVSALRGIGAGAEEIRAFEDGLKSAPVGRSAGGCCR